MNTTTELIPVKVEVSHPSAAALARGPEAALAMVESFDVNSPETFELASEELRSTKARLSKLEDQRKSITRPMDEAKAAVMDVFRSPVELLTRVESIWKSKMLAYQQEEQRKAEALRLEAEKAAQEERQRLESEAKKLEEEGRSGEAEVKRTVADMVVAAPAPAPAVPAAKGISTTTTVYFEVTDLLELVKHIAAHPELINLVATDTVKLRAYVKGLGLACNLPGVRVFNKQTMAARRA